MVDARQGRQPVLGWLRGSAGTRPLEPLVQLLVQLGEQTRWEAAPAWSEEGPTGASPRSPPGLEWVASGHDRVIDSSDAGDDGARRSSSSGASMSGAGQAGRGARPALRGRP